MPAGFQVWDASGNLIVTVTDRLTRVLGQVDTGTSNGSITDGNFSLGSPFFYYVSYSNSRPIYQPVITLTGISLSWSFNVSSPRFGGRIIYGIY